MFEAVRLTKPRRRVKTSRGVMHAWLVWCLFQHPKNIKCCEYDCACVCVCVRACVYVWSRSKIGVCGSSPSRPVNWQTVSCLCELKCLWAESAGKYGRAILYSVRSHLPHRLKKHSIINFINFCIALLYPNTFYNRYSRTLDISVLSFINGEKNAVPVKNVPAQRERLAARVNDWSHSWKEEWGMSAKYTADSDSQAAMI